MRRGFRNLTAHEAEHTSLPPIWAKDEPGCHHWVRRRARTQIAQPIDVELLEEAARDVSQYVKRVGVFVDRSCV